MGRFESYFRGRANRPCCWTESGSRVQWGAETGKKKWRWPILGRTLEEKWCCLRGGRGGGNWRRKTTQVYRPELPTRYLRINVKKSDKYNLRSQLTAEDVNMGLTSIRISGFQLKTKTNQKPHEIPAKAHRVRNPTVVLGSLRKHEFNPCGFRNHVGLG